MSDRPPWPCSPSSRDTVGSRSLAQPPSWRAEPSKSTPAAAPALALPPNDDERFAARRGSFFSSGGAIATSFRRRGAALDVVANSFGRSSSWYAVALAGGDAPSAWALIEEEDALGGCRDLLEEGAAAAAEAAAFLSFRSVAAEARIADCTGGRMWSSTLLYLSKKAQTRRGGEKGLPDSTLVKDWEESGVPIEMLE